MKIEFKAGKIKLNLHRQLFEFIESWLKQDNYVYPYRLVDVYKAGKMKCIGSASKIEDTKYNSSELFLTLDNDRNKFIGAVDIRIYHNKNSSIAYGISPQYRNQGYGKEQLKLAISKCELYGIKKINLLCNKNNIGSKRVIEANNAEFIREIQINNKTLIEYLIRY